MKAESGGIGFKTVAADMRKQWHSAERLPEEFANLPQSQPAHQ
jgi:hypothetical protein